MKHKHNYHREDDVWVNGERYKIRTAHWFPITNGAVYVDFPYSTDIKKYDADGTLCGGDFYDKGAWNRDEAQARHERLLAIFLKNDDCTIENIINIIERTEVH